MLGISYNKYINPIVPGPEDTLKRQNNPKNLTQL